MQTEKSENPAIVLLNHNNSCQTKKGNLCRDSKFLPKPLILLTRSGKQTQRGRVLAFANPARERTSNLLNSRRIYFRIPRRRFRTRFLCSFAGLRFGFTIKNVPLPRYSAWYRFSFTLGAA